MLCEKFDVKEQTGAKKALECGLKTECVPVLLALPPAVMFTGRY